MRGGEEADRAPSTSDADPLSTPRRAWTPCQMPEMATSKRGQPVRHPRRAGIAWAMRWRRWERHRAVTAERRSMKPATKKETAASRRMRRTLICPAATFGAGAATTSRLASWRPSLDGDRPFLGAALHHRCRGSTRRSPMVGQGQVGLGLVARRTCRSAPVSISREDICRWWRKVGGRPKPASVLVHHLGRGAGAGEEADIEMGELGDERPTHDDPGRPALDRRPRDVEHVDAIDAEERVRRRAGALAARAARGPGRRQSVTAEGAPDAARGHGDDQGQDEEERHRDGHGHQEPGEPRRVVRVLQGALLARRSEQAAEAVDHEFESQQERHPGQHQWWGPQIAAEPTVEQPGGHESAGEARVVESFEADEPGSLLTGHGVDGRVGVGPRLPGTHQHGARSRTGHTVQIGAAHDVDAEPGEGPVELACLSRRRFLQRHDP